MSARLVIGGAQFGAAYGIANTTGAPSRELLGRIFALARDAGVSWIDTARAYVGSEAAIGVALQDIDGWRPRIVTKIAPLELGKEDGARALVARVRDSLTMSRQFLQRLELDAVLVHRWQDFRREDGLVADVLAEEMIAGRVGTFGASIQTPAELLDALSTESLSHIQLPFNILDHRWDAVIPDIRRVRRQRILRVHVRSLLLQGLLVSDNPSHWRIARVSDATRVREWLSEHVNVCNRRSIQDLCFSWARAQDWIDGFVVGVETPAQMAGNLYDCVTPALSAQELDHIRKTRPHLTHENLNPALWKRQ